ncbi:hypothetical protein SCG7086_AA_00090 [Chlamydiales bacterium SCGC AG-110-P3]|nr:hypothetical protein SCG7086_AA_00090 [Chlamydiales bacterium SCGC AG-110-P3]
MPALSGYNAFGFHTRSQFINSAVNSSKQAGLMDTDEFKEATEKIKLLNIDSFMSELKTENNENELITSFRSFIHGIKEEIKKVDINEMLGSLTPTSAPESATGEEKPGATLKTQEMNDLSALLETKGTEGVEELLGEEELTALEAVLGPEGVNRLQETLKEQGIAGLEAILEGQEVEGLEAKAILEEKGAEIAKIKDGILIYKRLGNKIDQFNNLKKKMIKTLNDIEIGNTDPRDTRLINEIKEVKAFTDDLKTSINNLENDLTSQDLRNQINGVKDLTISIDRRLEDSILVFEVMTKKIEKFDNLSKRTLGIIKEIEKDDSKLSYSDISSLLSDTMQFKDEINNTINNPDNGLKHKVSDKTTKEMLVQIDEAINLLNDALKDFDEQITPVYEKINKKTVNPEEVSEIDKAKDIFKKSAFLFNSLNVIGYIPFFGGLLGIAKLVAIYFAENELNTLISDLDNKKDSGSLLQPDETRQYQNYLMAQSYLKGMKVRSAVEATSLGFLLIVPDIIFTIGRSTR